MHLIENTYETAGLLLLPPHARDIAQHLLTVTPLSELLLMWQNQKPNHELLIRHKVPVEFWEKIIDATLLAKTTYFLPNKTFNRDEVLYLIKAGCLAIKMPLDTYSVKDVIDAKSEDYPIFADWLKQFTKLLQKQTTA